MYGALSLIWNKNVKFNPTMAKFLTWADDLLYPCQGNEPSALVDDTLHTALLLADHAASFGMEFGYGVTKTAALFALHPRHHLAKCCWRAALSAVLLPIAEVYEHLGGIITADNHLAPEVQCRASWPVR